MAITEYDTMSAVTVGASEISLLSGTTSLQNDTTDGVYQVFVDGANMAKGDDFTLRVYEKVLSGSTKRVAMAWSVSGAQGSTFVTPPLVLMHGWDFTLQKVAGTDRAFDASIRQIG
jgi:hypothetical protein